MRSCRLKRVAQTTGRGQASQARDAKARRSKASGSPARRRPSRSPSRADLRGARHEIVIYDQDPKARRLPAPHPHAESRTSPARAVITRKSATITGIGNIALRTQTVDSMKAVLAECYDAGSVGSGADARPRSRRAGAQRKQPAKIHIGLDWLSSVSFGPQQDRQARDRDGSRATREGTAAAKRAVLVAQDVKVIVRYGFDEMKVVSVGEGKTRWGEDIPILKMLLSRRT